MYKVFTAEINEFAQESQKQETMHHMLIIDLLAQWSKYMVHTD